MLADSLSSIFCESHLRCRVAVCSGPYAVLLLHTLLQHCITVVSTMAQAKQLVDDSGGAFAFSEWQPCLL